MALAKPDYHAPVYQYMKGVARTAFTEKHSEDASLVERLVAEPLAWLDIAINRAAFSADDVRKIYAGVLESRRKLRDSLRAEGNDGLANLVSKDLESLRSFDDLSREQVFFEGTWNRILHALPYVDSEGSDYLELSDTEKIKSVILEAHAEALSKPRMTPREIAQSINRIAASYVYTTEFVDGRLVSKSPQRYAPVPGWSGSLGGSNE